MHTIVPQDSGVLLYERGDWGGGIVIFLLQEMNPELKFPENINGTNLYLYIHFLSVLMAVFQHYLK